MSDHPDVVSLQRDVDALQRRVENLEQVLAAQDLHLDTIRRAVVWMLTPKKSPKHPPAQAIQQD